jgi:hypothetical protein
VVFRVEAGFVGGAADWRGNGASDGGTGYPAVEELREREAVLSF